VHGDLVFDEGGLRLEFTDPLRGPVAREGGATGGSPQWAIEPIVHGRLRNGDEVTLLQATRKPNFRGSAKLISGGARCPVMFCGAIRPFVL
jgi:hypothetical protein